VLGDAMPNRCDLAITEIGPQMRRQEMAHRFIVPGLHQARQFWILCHIVFDYFDFI
jgi:hypothetical protein